jgi:hypothetical protein
MENEIANHLSRKNTARLAGLLYLIFGITSAYGLMYFPSHPVIGGDSLATIKSILNDEFSFRAKIVSHLASAILFIQLVFTLYKLLKPVNEHQARLMVAFVLVQVPIVFLLETFDFTVLMAIKGELTDPVSPDVAQDFARAFLKVRNYGIVVLELFWGLWLIPFGQFVYKSRFIPRIIGISLVVGGIAYMVESLTILLFPDYRMLVSKFAFVFYYAAELSIILWLLIMGAKKVP